MHLLLPLLLACAGGPVAPEAATPPSGPLEIAALSFPAAWLAERVGGAAVVVRNVSPPGEDPPHWQPGPDVIASLVDARLVVANGAGFEAWTRTATLPEDRVVSTADGLELLQVEGRTHSHGKAGEHSHAGTDPHTWSDPLAFLAQGKAVHDALVREDPAHSDTYDAGLAALQAELTALHEALAAALEPARGVPLAANHPAYGYLARRYQLTLTAFDLDPEEAPDAEDAQAVAAWAASAGAAPVMFWEAAPAEAATAALPPTLRHVVLDPLEQPADGAYDYLAQSRANAAVLAALFAP